MRSSTWSNGLVSPTIVPGHSCGANQSVRMEDFPCHCPEKAQQAWQKSLAIATEMDMRFDLALAHYQIASHQQPQQPKRATHLQQAAVLFQQMQTPYFLAQAQAELAV